MSREKRPFAQSQGIGDSRIFAAPEGTFPETSILDCHVGGVLVRDMPEDSQSRILYQQTDEGYAERNAGRVESAARVTAGPLDKAIQARGDDALEPWQAPDPMKELADRYVRPGFKPRFLSDRKCDKDGMRGFRPVIAENGDPVRLGTLTLAEMPVDKAAARNRHYQDKSKEDLREIWDEYTEKQEKAIRDAGARGASVLRPGELLSDGRESGAIGLHSVRGNSAEL